MVYHFAFAGILIFSFFVRFGLRLKYKDALSSDTYFHMSTARSIRESGFKIPKTVDNYVLPHEHLYPHLYHVILAMFGEASRRLVERLSAAFFDTLNVAITYLFFNHYLVEMHFKDAEYWSLVFCAVVAISPGLLRTYGGPRAYNGSPRILGQFLYLSHFYAFIIFAQDGNFWFLGVAAVALALLTFTAKFGVQVALFFAPAFFFVDWYYGAVLGGAFVIAIILTKGLALRILQTNFVHSYSYFYKQKEILYPRHRTVKHYLQAVKWNLACLLKEGKVKQFLRWIFSEKHSIHLLIIMFPYYIILIVSLFYGPSWTPMFTGLYALTFASLIVFFLTKNKPFLFLGEAERYLEYALFALVPFGLIWCMLFQLEWVIYAYLGYSFLLMLHFIPIVSKFLSRMEKDALELESFKEVLAVEGGGRGRVFPNPCYLTKDIVYHFDCKVVSYYPGSVDEKLLSREENDFIYHNGGQEISKHIFEVFDKYEVLFLLCTKEAMKTFFENVFEQERSEFDAQMELLKETDKFQLYRYKQKS
jgi:hypothetical protein